LTRHTTFSMNWTLATLLMQLSLHLLNFKSCSKISIKWKSVYIQH